MKRILSIISIAAVLTACNSKGKDDLSLSNSAITVADTAGLADFKAYQNWKLQSQAAEATTVAYAVNRKPARRSTTSGSRKSDTYNTGSRSTETSYPAKEPEKKGWSKAAKGAAIGAGSGAVLGAVVHKRNRVVGAVVGGVAGGAVGYGIGRHMDKRDGRY